MSTAKAVQQKFHSGIARAVGPTVSDKAPAIIRAANQTFEQRVGDRLELPIAVLVEQRDAALEELAGARETAQIELDTLESKHELFVRSLLQQHQRELDVLKTGLDELRGDRAPTVLPPAHPASADKAKSERTTQADLELTIAQLRRELEAANAEVEATRQDAIRIQADRDEALTTADDQRLALLTELDSTRDQVIEIQAALDEALRQLEDARDQARDEQARLLEENADLRRALETFH